MGNSRPYIGLYDKKMWESFDEKQWRLQQFTASGLFVYPPAPVCPKTYTTEHEWVPVSGKATILSWCVFHRQYFDDLPPPYNCVAVRLAEGPIFVTNLVGDEPEGEWIGREVEIVYEPYQDRTVPKVRLTT